MRRTSPTSRYVFVAATLPTLPNVYQRIDTKNFSEC